MCVFGERAQALDVFIIIIIGFLFLFLILNWLGSCANEVLFGYLMEILGSGAFIMLVSWMVKPAENRHKSRLVLVACVFNPSGLANDPGNDEWDDFVMWSIPP